MKQKSGNRGTARVSRFFVCKAGVDILHEAWYNRSTNGGNVEQYDKRNTNKIEKKGGDQTMKKRKKILAVRYALALLLNGAQAVR